MTKRKGVRLNADILVGEMDILEVYSDQVARSKTELIREWVRGLEDSLTPESKQLLANRREEHALS
jgi:hypothetical protein